MSLTKYFYIYSLCSILRDCTWGFDLEAMPACGDQKGLSREAGGRLSGIREFLGRKGSAGFPFTSGLIVSSLSKNKAGANGRVALISF